VGMSTTKAHVERVMPQHHLREHLAFFKKALSDIKGYNGKLGESLYSNSTYGRKGRLASVHPDSKESWADVDIPDPKQSEFDTKVGLLKAEFGRMVGDRPIRVRMVLPGTHAATVTTGVVNGTITIDASQFTDWSSFSVVFDEYKISRGDIQWTTAASPVTVVTVNSIYVWCYDPADSTMLVSTAGGFLQEQHKLYGLTNTNGYGAVGTYPAGSCHLFRFHVPKGVMVRGTVTVGDVWVPTVAPVPFGYVKTYFVGSTVTAVAVTTWMAAIDVVFRVRT